jgi:uncharacterized protein
MIALISPAKTLDFESVVDNISLSEPRFKSEQKALLQVMKGQSVDDLKNLMKLSHRLAQINMERYALMQSAASKKERKPAVFAFQGDVYQGLDAASLPTATNDFMQSHLRILSGYYGLLRPFDLINAYRLEMGTSISIGDHPNLYAFWGEKITDELNKDIKAADAQCVINLASQEYFKAVKPKKLDVPVVNVEFLDEKNGRYKVISFFAKKARGLMSRFIIENQLTQAESLKAFDYEGYAFEPSLSTDYYYVFTRMQR